MVAYLASAMIGGSVFLAAWQFGRLGAGRRDPSLDGATFEASRRAALRKASRLYRYFEPQVDELAPLAEGPRGRGLRERIEGDLAILLEEPPWTAAEWLTVARLRAAARALGLGLPVGGGLALAGGGFTPLPAFLGLIFLIESWRAVRTLRGRALRTRGSLRNDLPFSVELLRLTLQAGAGFVEALSALIRHTRGTVISGHMGAVLREIECGTTRSDALRRFQDRVASDEARELVFALRQGDALGTPLGEVLESQARQLRFRQSQAVEKAAEQSKGRFVWPCIVLMLSCIIAMLGPWLLKVYYDYEIFFG